MASERARRLPPALLLALACPVAPAVAASYDDDALYAHPLLSEEARPVLDALAHLPPEEVLPMLELYTGVAIDAEGVATVRSGVRLAEVSHDPAALPGDEPVQDGPAVDPAVEALLERIEDPDALVYVAVGVRPDAWDPGAPIAVQEQWAMIDGRVLTWGDHRRFREEALAVRTSAGFDAVEPLLVSVQALGGEVVDVVGFTAQANVLLPVGAIPALLEDPLLGALDLITEGAPDAGHAWTVTGNDITGHEAEDLLQSTQFYDRGYSGADVIGQIEGGADTIFNNHPGLKDAAGNRRVANCWWTGTYCLSTYPASGDAHATAVASVMVGDITAGQDTSISSSGVARRERSGVARTSDIRGVTPGDNLENALAVFMDGQYPVDLINMSMSWNNTDLTCTGKGTLATNANAFFEAGIPFFKSAGNKGNRTATDCTIGAPGAAIGLFPVGAYEIDWNDDEVIYDWTATGGSSRGGVSYAEGRDRTIVALAGPAMWEFPYPYSASLLDVNGDPLVYGTDWSSSAVAGPENFCCTSAATPAVTGSASVFREWFHDVYGAAVDDPGILYTNLMLMGDRTQEGTAVRMTEDFDPLWGAGKLRLRAFDSVGLDGPASWNTGTSCVANGATVSVNVGSSVLSSDVDVIRAVIWWYDRRFDDSSTTDHDNVNLRLAYTSGGTDYLVALANTEDNRQRIHQVPSTFGVQYKLKLVGNDVTADDEGCGTNSMRVFWAYFTEDSGREFAENLSTIRQG